MKKIISFALVLILLLSAFSVSAFSISGKYDPENKYNYEETIISKAFMGYELENLWFEVYYHEEYEFYSTDDIIYDESTPDYVLVNLQSNLVYDLNSLDILGDYILRESSKMIPYPYGRCIYVPKEDKIYSLPEAYRMNIEGIENVFTEACVGELIGDMDKDRLITIKDATEIQKCLAGISEFDRFDMIDGMLLTKGSILCSISDFNRDCERNIQDATAIQKYIAGLEY